MRADQTSYSQIRRFEQCPKSFELHYRQRLPAEESELAAFGKVVHAACEGIVREHVNAGGTGLLSPERAQHHYAEAWRASVLSGLALYQEGAKMMADFVRDQGALDGSSVLATEQRFRLPVGRVTLIGVIDRVDRLGAETIEVIDCKTNHQLFTRDELENDLQLPVYAAVAKCLWPWAKEVRLTYWMLRHSVRVPLVRTKEQIAGALAYVENAAGKAANAESFPAKLGGYCAYCDHRKQCDAYAAVLRGERESIGATPDDLVAVANEREEVAGMVKILDGRKRELEGILRARLKITDELRLSGMRYRMIPTRSAAAHPLRPTLEALATASGVDREDLLDRIAVIDTDALETFVDGLEVPKRRLTMLRAELEARATRTVSPRFSASAERNVNQEVSG